MKINRKFTKEVLRKIKVLVQVLLLLAISLIVYYFSKNDERQKNQQVEICLRYTESQFVGIIESTFIDHSKKGRHYFKIKNSNDTLRMWYYGTYGLTIGDSIVKEKGKSEYVIYKQHYSDSVLILKFDCNK